jgi:hypothetical protein
MEAAYQRIQRLEKRLEGEDVARLVPVETQIVVEGLLVIAQAVQELTGELGEIQRTVARLQ